MSAKNVTAADESESTGVRWRLAAHFGHATAIERTGHRAPKPFEKWVRGIVSDGWPDDPDWSAVPVVWEAAARAAYVAASLPQAPTDAFARYHGDCLDAAEAWIVEPGLERAIAAHEVLSGSRISCLPAEVMAAARACASTRTPGGTDYFPKLASLEEHCWLSCKAAAQALGKGGRDRVRQTVRDELVPWLLGDGDPVADRIEARRS